MLRSMHAEPSAEPEGPSAEKVKHIFDEVAHGYDRANGFMTFGLVNRWRKQLVKWSGVQPGDSVLDCATGTGDLALDFKRAVGEQGRVIGTDFCQSMLDHAPAKAESQHLEVDFSQADVTDLPFPDDQFEVVSIAYGIRNVDRPKVALSEMARVCKPGGRVMVLETGENRKGVSAFFHWGFSEYIVPFLGMVATGKRWPYEYLRDSSRAFPSGEEFLGWMATSADFSELEYRRLFLGSSFLYRGKI